jgi:hypothetical protein
VRRGAKNPRSLADSATVRRDKSCWPIMEGEDVVNHVREAAVELAPEPKKAKGELDPAEWDFSRVPSEELPACFLWEYARESEWLRNLRERCLAFWRGGSNKASDPALDSDLRIVQVAMPYASEVFLSGFFFEHDEKSQSEDPKAPHYRHPQAPAITGSFPASWQSLTQAERQHRAHIRSDVETIPLAPFGRGYDFHCDLIRDHSKRERERQIADCGHAVCMGDVAPTDLPPQSRA